MLLEGLRVLSYQEPLLHPINGQLTPTPQLVLGSDNELPENIVARLVAYLPQRLGETLGTGKRFYSNDYIDYGVVQVCGINQGREERERMFYVDQSSPNTVQITEWATQEHSTFLEELKEELSRQD